LLPKWSLLVGVSLEGWILWGRVLLEVRRIVAGGRVRVRI
jgi:hypothetical protein